MKIAVGTQNLRLMIFPFWQFLGFGERERNPTLTI